jgi:hypothetical protein
MNSPGLWFGLLILVTAAISAFLNEPASKNKKWAKNGLIVITVINFGAGSYILVDNTRSSDEQTRKLGQIAKDEQTAIKTANELVTNLGKTQATAEKISTAFGTTSITVNNTLTETKRGLQPLQTLGIQFELELPATDPDVTSILEKYRKLIKAYPPDTLINHPDPRFFLLTGPMRGMGFVFPPQSPDYPKADTALGFLTRSFRVNMQFHIRHYPPARYGHDPKPNPDIGIDFVEDTSQPTVHLSRSLQTDITGPLIYVLSSNIPRESWRSNGRILSVTDLIQAQIVAQPVFAVPPTDQYKEYQLDRAMLAEAQLLWEGVKLHAITLHTQDGRRWAFDVAQSTTVLQLKVPIFVGQFHRLLQPLDAQ